MEPATVAELEVIVSHMKPPQYRLAILLMAWCALRFGEVTELRRSDIDVRRKNRIHVQRGVVLVDGERQVTTPKSEAGIRWVTIPPHLVPVVREHLDTYVERRPDALLFTGRNGGHLAQSTLNGKPGRTRLIKGRVVNESASGFKGAAEAAGRPDLRLHDLRHSGAVLAAQTGATLAELMARLGHSTPPAAAMRYQHAAKDRDARLPKHSRGWPSMPDSYRLTVTCSHQGRPDVTADTRTVTVITHHTPPPTEGETFGFLEWRDGGNALRTQWGRPGRAHDHRERPGPARPPRRARQAPDRPPDRGARWAAPGGGFGAPTAVTHCRAAGARLEPVLERLRVAGGHHHRPCPPPECSSVEVGTSRATVPLRFAGPAPPGRFPPLPWRQSCPIRRNPQDLPAHAKYVRQEVAAERWDVSVDTIRRLIASGKITGYRLNRRVIRVDLDEVDAASVRFRRWPDDRGTK